MNPTCQSNTTFICLKISQSIVSKKHKQGDINWYESLIYYPVTAQVDGRCTPHLASLHPYQTPFVLIPGFFRRTQSAPLINLGTPSTPPNIRGTEGVLNLECTF